MKRVFIIHGWGGYPEEGWFPWLKKELEAKGIEVHVPAMPDSDNPKIEIWIPFLTEQVGVPDADTYFVGHSVGSQAVLRYLATLSAGVKVGGAVFVAPWLALDEETIREEGPESVEIAKPWVEMPIDWEKVRTHADKFFAIFSDDDPFVPIENQKLFQERLEAKTVIEHSKGHFGGGDGIKELPIVLEQLERIMQ